MYASPVDEDHNRIDHQRYNLLGEQLRIYKQDEIHWCIWLYQDIGYQGMFHANPHSAHMRRPNPFFEKEKRVDVDKWSRESASDAEQAAD